MILFFKRHLEQGFNRRNTALRNINSVFVAALVNVLAQEMGIIASVKMALLETVVKCSLTTLMKTPT